MNLFGNFGIKKRMGLDFPPGKDFLRWSDCLLLVIVYFQVARCDDLDDHYDQHKDANLDEGCLDQFNSTEITSNEKKQGVISSPNFQGGCPKDVVRNYLFKGAVDERVQLVFTDMQLEMEELNGASHCDNGDYIKVSVILKGAMREIDTYCGSKNPPTLMSSESDMEVYFVRRSSTSKPGIAFTANYSFVRDFGIRSGIQITSNPDIACMFEYHSDHSTNGTFTSPNFPGLYPKNCECHYIFHGEPNERIYINFIYFDVEGTQPGCSDESQSDYVELSNFNIPLIDRKMDRLCGHKIPHNRKQIYSDGDFFRVTFKSNDIYDAAGFEAFYQFRQTKEPFQPPRTDKSPNSNGRNLAPGDTWFLFFLYYLFV